MMDGYLRIDTQIFPLSRVDIRTYINRNLVAPERTWSLDVYNPRQKAEDRARDDGGGTVFSLQHVLMPGVESRHDLLRGPVTLSSDELNKYGSEIYVSHERGRAQSATLRVSLAGDQLSVKGGGIVEVAGRQLAFEFQGPASFAEFVAETLEAEKPAHQAASRRHLRAILAYLAAPEQQLSYKSAVPHARIPRELVKQWRDAYLSEVRWFVEAFSAEELGALGQLDGLLRQIHIQLGQPLPDVPEIFAAEPWQRIMRTARATLALLAQRPEADEGEAP
jgi:hypothetical protein